MKTQLINCQSILYMIIFLFGISQIVQGHNIFSYLPPFKSIIDECQLNNPHWKIRLYEQNLGATTSYSYDVTAQQDFFSTEYTIYGTYGFLVDKVSCEDNELRIIPMVESQDIIIYSDEIPALIREPLIYYYMELQERSPDQVKNIALILRLLNISCCLPLLIPGIFLGISIYHKRLHG